MKGRNAWADFSRGTTQCDPNESEALHAAAAVTLSLLLIFLLREAP